MTGNHPEGFEGFQSRMEQMEEQLGGDWLASRIVEQYWAEGMDSAMHIVHRRHEEVGLAYRAHHRGAWVRASAAEWRAAADHAEARFASVPPADIVARAEREGQAYALTGNRLLRLGRDPEGPAILLAGSHATFDPFAPDTEVDVSLTETGLALIESLQFKRVRTKHRRAKRSNIGKTLRNFAEAMGVVFT